MMLSRVQQSLTLGSTFSYINSGHAPSTVPGENKEISMNIFIILSYVGVGNATVFMYSVYRYE
jgi:hypothetical protein